MKLSNSIFSSLHPPEIRIFAKKKKGLYDRFILNGILISGDSCGKGETKDRFFIWLPVVEAAK